MQDEGALATAAPAAKEQPENPVEYSLSAGIVALLGRLRLSLAFSSYQSGFLFINPLCSFLVFP